MQTLPTLIRQCKSDRKWEERVDAAETLACLIEVDVNLQNTAAISDQIITTLNEYFRYPGSPPDASLMPTTKVALDFTCFKQIYFEYCERYLLTWSTVITKIRREFATL